MRLEAGCEITFEVGAPTPMLLMLRPRSGYSQWVAREEYTLEPHVPVIEFTDGAAGLKPSACMTKAACAAWGGASGRLCI